MRAHARLVKVFDLLLQVLSFSARNENHLRSRDFLQGHTAMSPPNRCLDVSGHWQVNTSTRARALHRVPTPLQIWIMAVPPQIRSTAKQRSQIERISKPWGYNCLDDLGCTPIRKWPTMVLGLTWSYNHGYIQLIQVLSFEWPGIEP